MCVCAIGFLVTDSAAVVAVVQFQELRNNALDRAQCEPLKDLNGK